MLSMPSYDWHWDKTQSFNSVLSRDSLFPLRVATSAMIKRIGKLFLWIYIQKIFLLSAHHFPVVSQKSIYQVNSVALVPGGFQSLQFPFFPERLECFASRPAFHILHLGALQSLHVCVVNPLHSDAFTRKLRWFRNCSVFDMTKWNVLHASFTEAEPRRAVRHQLIAWLRVIHAVAVIFIVAIQSFSELPATAGGMDWVLALNDVPRLGNVFEFDLHHCGVWKWATGESQQARLVFIVKLCTNLAATVKWDWNVLGCTCLRLCRRGCLIFSPDFN